MESLTVARDEDEWSRETVQSTSVREVCEIGGTG